MLEKIGLPVKPSMRGASWVVDASHCQGCSSQFTFINRKHHCRRCGGLFCNSCTQQRMSLRGQGDSPVRICDPCKKLEDATRFELRYGHKSRGAKDSSKLAPKHEDEVLNQIIGSDGKQAFLSGRPPQSDVVSDSQSAPSSASCSNTQEEFVTPDREGDILRSISVDMHNNASNEVGSTSPEELRQQAVEEKKKYRILKGEGKSEEALQAFKRGKDLERQAEALDIALRKSRRKASTLSSFTGTQKTNDVHEGSVGKRKLPSQMGKEGKDDLASELRELGWSDADLQNAERKPGNLSLEGELSNILREVPQKSRLGRGTSGIDKTQVLAHKKKALMFKREGKLNEAKEELKKAKILEKELEEQELLAEADDSDDELSALIRSMDNDKQDDLSLDYAHDPSIDFDHLSGVADDLAFDVTDVDMSDPEIAAALKSFGWSEEDDHLEEDGVQSASLHHEALLAEVLSLKREALNQKRAGNVAEAMELLKKAKLLERDLNSIQPHAQNSEADILQKQSTPQISGNSSLSRTLDDEYVTKMKDRDLKPPPKSKLAIQRELLGLKKKALALRREGRLDEAEEELRKGKDLEHQLEEIDNAPNFVAAKLDVGKKSLQPDHIHQDAPVTLGFVEDGEETEVTEQDMCDPALLSVLNNLGWKDEDVETVGITEKPSKQISDKSTHESGHSAKPVKVLRSKAEIQKELLGVKRKALALRRQGKTEEAEEELAKAKVLENQIEELEVASTELRSGGFRSMIPEERPENLKIAGNLLIGDVDLSSFIKSIVPTDEADVALEVSDTASKKESGTIKPPPTSSSTNLLETFGFKSQSTAKLDSSDEQTAVECLTILPQSAQSEDLVDLLTGNHQKSPQTPILQVSHEHNPNASILPLAGATVQSEVPISAKESTASEEEISDSVLNHHISGRKETAAPASNQLPRHEANKDQILARKRKAVALKREGKLAEAREELRQAKLLEKSLEEDSQKGNVDGKNTSASADTYVMQESKPSLTQKPMSGRDRFKLQQESLAHKRQALKLRREGRMEESEAEFELAKQLETQLEEFDNHSSSTNKPIDKVESMDDSLVEDLIDPQLMLALKGIGWEEGDFSTHMHMPQKSEAKTNTGKNADIIPERSHLEEQIKAEKLRALNLKRAGKQAEALEALRAAKRLEKKLVSLPS